MNLKQAKRLRKEMRDSFKDKTIFKKNFKELCFDKVEDEQKRLVLKANNKYNYLRLYRNEKVNRKFNS